MRELRGEVTVFYSTHILDDVERVSDHVAILDGGRLVQLRPDRRAPRELRPGPAAGRHRRRRRRDRRRHGLRSPASSRSNPPSAPPTCAAYLVRVDAGRHRRRPGGDHPVRRRPRTDRHREPARPPRAGRRLPPPRQHQGACGMTASTSSPPEPLPRQTRRTDALLGLRTAAPQGPGRMGPRQARRGSSLVVTAAFMALTAANAWHQHLAHRQPPRMRSSRTDRSRWPRSTNFRPPSGPRSSSSPRSSRR